MGSMAGDYTTPNNGDTYSLSQIASLAPSTVYFSNPTSFTLSGTLNISPLDTLQISGGEGLRALTNPDSPAYGIIVRGRILVLGTEGSPAVLSSYDAVPGCWRGIIIMSEGVDVSHIDHARIEYAAVGVNVRGKATPLIENSEFYRCMYASMSVGPGFSAVIRNNTITSWERGAGVVLDTASAAEITSNTITGGAVGIVTSGSDAATYLSENHTIMNDAGFVSATSDRAIVENNRFESGYLGGVAADYSTAFWNKNTMENQQMAGMGITNDATPKLRQNIFKGNGTLGGIFISNNAVPGLGTTGDPGLNDFAHITNWNLVNFSSRDQYAPGNVWSALSPGDVIYDYADDQSDADGNGVISGRVYLSQSATSHSWILYR